MGDEHKYEVTQDSKNIFKRFFKNKKVSIPIIILVCILVVVAFLYTTFGIGMTDTHKDKAIMGASATKNYEKAKNLAMRYYNNDANKQEQYITLINMLEEAGVGTLEEYTLHLQQLTQKAKEMNVLKIEKVEIVPKNYGEYHDINVTVRNTGDKNISYVKINLYFKDKDGNIIASDWTNDNSRILPNAQQTISKMVSDKIRYHTVTAEIAEFNYIK